MWCYVVSREEYWEKYRIYKKDIWMSLCFTFLSMIRRYIATFYDFRKEQKVLYIIAFHCPLLALDLKTEDCFK